MQALLLALDVALGMRHAHSCRTVHGDLKPDNVLLVFRCPEQIGQTGSLGSPDAKTPTSLREHGGLLPLAAKVPDFGLSTPLAEGATHASQHFHGTPAYVAPEVFIAGQLSPRSDVWSFGLMLVELFYGCTLEALGTNQPVSLQQLQTRLLKDMRASPQPGYAQLTAACLSVDPHARPDFCSIADRLMNEFHLMADDDDFA